MPRLPPLLRQLRDPLGLGPAAQSRRSRALRPRTATADRVVARADKALRRGRVLVDWGQNDRHKSTVAAHSLRAKRAFPTVSAPLTWEELTAAVSARDEGALLLGPDEALRRVDEHGDLFAPVLSVVQRLP